MPKELTDPKCTIGNDGVLFGELVGWGARVAVGEYAPFLPQCTCLLNCLSELYQHKRENWLKQEIYNRALELDDIAAKSVSTHPPSTL